MNDDQATDTTNSQPASLDQVVASPSPETSAALVTDQPVEAPDTAVEDDQPTGSAPIEFSWQASEFVQHHKNGLWYGGVAFAVLILSVGAYFLKSWLSIALFLVMGVAVVVYAKRPPRTLTYDLSADGLTIDGKVYPYNTFRSFSVLRDVSWHSIDLEPTQRFMPRLSVLFDDKDFDPIVNHLLEHLPRVDRRPDIIERATRYLRF